jgi:methyl-accepting chemotaxis protein
VVAEEVRKLAERTAQSTKEISQLILGIQRETQTAVAQMERSTSLMEHGMTLSRRVAEALEAIAKAATEVAEHARAIGGATTEQSRGSEEISRSAVRLTEIIQEISAATEEQSAGTSQVVKAMERMRATIQQTAARVTQLAVSAEQLAQQSTAMQEAVAQFITENGRGPSARPSPRS